jgi:hypothetical protein
MIDHDKTYPTSTLFWLCLATFTFGLVLRAIGLDWGYFHGDERINDAAKVLSGDLAPGQLFYPPFVHYLNATGFAGLFGVGLLLGWWDGVAGFRAQYFEDPSIFFMTARWIMAVLGAMMAPLFLLIARRVGLSLPVAIVCGLAGVLFPLGVLMGHIAKGDTALATFTIAALWAALARLDTPNPRRWDFLFGLFVVLALSFKQSALFVLAPMSLAYLVLIALKEGARALGLSFVRGISLVLVLWPLLNIGILLRFQDFLEYQKIQSVMSVRGTDEPMVGLMTFIDMILRADIGLSPVFALVALIAPVLMLWKQGVIRNDKLLVFTWIGGVVASGFLAYVAGERQPEHLWIANFSLFLLMACLALGAIVQTASGALRWVATGVFALGLAWLAVGAGDVVRQAVATPLGDDVDALITEDYPDRKIVSMVDSNLPITPDAQAMMIARLDRLAAKYNVDMPPIAEERLITEAAPDAVFRVDMPVVMGGLEVADDDEDYEVQPHTWPYQAEEWTLTYWLDHGIDVIIFEGIDEMYNRQGTQFMVDFYEEAVARCGIASEMLARKPLYIEFDITIFDCKDAHP